MKKYYYTRKEVSEWLRKNKTINHKEIDKVLLKVKKPEKFIPKESEKYYFYTDWGNIEKDYYYPNDGADEWRLKIGNCFKTEKEAKPYRQKLIDLGKEK